MTAAGFVARLRANVDDFYADRTTYEEFTRRQGATWDEIKLAGKDIEEAVLKALREKAQPALFSLA